MAKRLNGAAGWVAILVVVVLAIATGAVGYGKLNGQVKTNTGNIEKIHEKLDDLVVGQARIEEILKGMRE